MLKLNRGLWAVSLMGLAGILVLASCDKDNTEPPKPLVPFTPTVQVKEVFNHEPVDGTGLAFLSLGPVIDQNALITDDRKGNVSSSNALTGRSNWHVYLRQPLSSTPGVFGGKVYVGTLKGVLIALDEKTGRVLWQANLPSTILAAPAGNDDLVVVHSHDGSVTALDAGTGRQLWQVLGDTPSLTMEGDSSPVLFNNTVIVGSDNGQLTSYQLADGQLNWERPVAIPAGGTDLSQMVDMIGTPVIDDDVVYAATYHGNVVAVDAMDGSLVWQHPVSSLKTIAISDKAVFVTNEKGHVIAFDKETGEELWTQNAFEARFTTGPAVLGNYVIVGDYAGYVHWLNTQNGHQAAQAQMGSHTISANPVIFENRVYLEDTDGRVVAYQI